MITQCPAKPTVGEIEKCVLMLDGAICGWE